jgi:hypothetical protein
MGWRDETRRILSILSIQSFVGQEIKEEMKDAEYDCNKCGENSTGPLQFGTQAPDMTPAPHEQVPAKHSGVVLSFCVYTKYTHVSGFE